MKPKFKQFLKKRTIMLLFSVLASVTMWADDVTYYNPTAAEGQQNPTVDATLITSETTELYEGWYYVSGEVTCNNRIEVNGTVNIILENGCSFTASDGIHVPGGYDFMLNIYAQKAGSGCGVLTAYRYQRGDYGDGAAIGGDGGNNNSGFAEPGENSGTIGIYGGNITAYGNIGGGNGGYGADRIDEWNSDYGYGGKGGDGNVYIYGGMVTVSNGNIGGGDAGKGDFSYGECGGGFVNLTWTNSTDGIYASNYYGNVKLDKNFSSENNDVFTKSEYNGYDSYNQCGMNGVTLIPAGDVYTIAISDSYNPECFVLDKDMGFEGTPITLTAINGYTVSSVTVTKDGGGTVSATDNQNGTWSFTMPAKNVTVTATASHTHYEIATANDVNLSVNASDKLVQGGKTFYRVGATIPFTLTPMGENFELSDLNVYHTDDVETKITPSQSGSTYSFTMPAASVTISPSWLQTSFSISMYNSMSLDVSDGGTVTINNHVYYLPNATVTVTVIPPTNKYVSVFRVKKSEDNSDVDYTKNINGTYTFTMPASDVEVSASFAKDDHGIILLKGTDFTVTSGTSTVEPTEENEDAYYRVYKKGDSDEGEGCTRLLDGYSDEYEFTKWCVQSFDKFDQDKITPYVEFQTAAPVVPKQYVLITGNDNEQYQGRNPLAWNILAKAQENDGWTTIAAVTNSCNDMWDQNYTAYTFDFNNTDNNAYQYFRFEVLGTQGYIEYDEFGNPTTHAVNVMQLSEFQMWVQETEKLTGKENDGLYWTSYYNGTKGYRIDDENACAYTATYSENTLTLHKLGKVIPANTAVIIVDEDDRISMNLSHAAGENNVSNDLKGVDVSTAKSTLGTGTFYVLSKKGDDFGFFQYTGTNMPAHKAYLLVDGGAAQGRGLTMVFDNETTSINEEFLAKTNDKAERRMKNEEEWFALDGRRLNGKPTTKGMYINNGRKVVIK